MKITKEIELQNFEFWSGARQLADYLTEEEFQTIENIIDDGQGEWTETNINNLFWFDSDWICEQIGYEDFEDFIERRCK